jgi:hypothetical protein
MVQRLQQDAQNSGLATLPANTLGRLWFLQATVKTRRKKHALCGQGTTLQSAEKLRLFEGHELLRLQDTQVLKGTSFSGCGRSGF